MVISFGLTILIDKGLSSIGQNGNSGMASDINGNAYYAGSFNDTSIFGSDILINTVHKINTNCTNFLAKYDPNGNVKWGRQSTLISDSSIIAANAVSTDTKGNCFVAGLFEDTVTIGVDTLRTPSPSVGYTFLIKYDSNGNVKWVRESTGTTKYGATAKGIANDRYGNSFITGYFADTIAFGTYTLDTHSDYNEGLAFIAKYDSNGNVLWAKQAISSPYSGSIGMSITTDIIGNAYLLGQFSDTVFFGSYRLIGPYNGSIYSPQQSIFLVKYDPNGNVLWAKQVQVLDNNNWAPGKIYISIMIFIFKEGEGREIGTKFGNTTLQINDTARYDAASFILKLDSNGNVLCDDIISGGGAKAPFIGLATDSSGKYVYIGSSAFTPLSFGNDTVNPFSIPVNPILENLPVSLL